MTETVGLSIVKNLADAIELATNYSISAHQDEIVLIGGAKIFDEGMKYVNKLVISWVDAPNIQGDVYFPSFDLTGWPSCKIKARKIYIALNIGGIYPRNN